MGDESSEDEDEESARYEHLEALLDVPQEELRLEDLPAWDRRRFKELLAAGALAGLAPWEFWWYSQVVEVTGEPEADHLCCGKDRRCHPSVGFTVVAALYAFAHTRRRFNGDWDWDRCAAFTEVAALAPALVDPKRPPMETTAGQMAECVGAAGVRKSPHALNIRCIADVEALLAVPSHPVRALGELVALVEGIDAVWRARKKLLFLQGFARFHEAELAVLRRSVASVVADMARGAERSDAMAELRAATRDDVVLPGRPE